MRKMRNIATEEQRAFLGFGQVDESVTGPDVIIAVPDLAGDRNGIGLVVGGPS